MAVAIVLDEDWEVEPSLWAATPFARAAQEPLVVFLLDEKPGAETKTSKLSGTKRPSTPVVEAVFQALADSPALTPGDSAPGDAIPVEVIQVTSGQIVDTMLDQVVAQEVSLLILPRHASARGLDPELAWERELFLRAPCETMLLRPAGPDQQPPRDLLVPVDGRLPSQAALRLADRLRRSEGTSLTALYVEPNVDEFANEVGERIADRIVRRALGGQEGVTVEVVLGSSIKESIAKRAADEHGLLLLGANRQGAGQRWRRSSISEWLMARGTGPTVAVVRPAIPLRSRLAARIERLLKARVPQLDRHQRVSLVERVQGSSLWDFDFISLICLSTLIASLGLLQNSPAVVIGAMLVAPLMTPLVGAGLSLVQGNRLLIRHASSTVLKGFVLAYVLALFVGWVARPGGETLEMLARGSPNGLDFIVALISGVAGAYALGRPNLLSALPGVAIAAALVPPVATAGLATSLGNSSLASGAMLLFVTNIVAIVLGTAAALWAVGIRPVHEHGVLQSWVFRLSAALMLLAFLIAVYEMVPQQRVSRSLRADIEQVLSSRPGTSLVELNRSARGKLNVVLASPSPVDADTVRALGRAARADLGDEFTLQIETRLVLVVPRPESREPPSEPLLPATTSD